jgi:hypothetical protein
MEVFMSCFVFTLALYMKDECQCKHRARNDFFHQTSRAQGFALLMHAGRRLLETARGEKRCMALSTATQLGSVRFRVSSSSLEQAAPSSS